MKLVTNKDASKIVSLTCNLLPSKCRLETLEEKEFTVVPMVMLTEGVHCGSMGPLLYNKKELSKTPVVWNHKPVVVYHPTMNGQGISACDQTVINSRKVGIIMNTTFEDGKLKAEAWLDATRADKVDERIMAAVQNEEMMELSTGVFIDIEDAEGEHNGEAYVGIARNFRPDHLALLPDQIGACSIADGAGFLRNQARKHNVSMDVLREALAKIGLAGNELSHLDIEVKLREQLSKRFGQTEELSLWVADVFQNFVVFDMNNELFRLGYTSNDTEVVLSEDQPVRVERVSEYRTVENKTEETNIMEKKKLIDAIIGNSGWVEEDRKALEAMSVDQLKRIIPVKNDDGAASTAAENGEAKEGAEEPKTEAASTEEPKTEATGSAAEPAKNKEEKVISLNEYIGKAPKEIQEVLNEGVSTYNAQKQEIVERILAHKSNSFTKNELNERPLGELKKMAQLMGVPQTEKQSQPANYAGQAPIDNASGVEEPLAVPAMNFDSK